MLTTVFGGIRPRRRRAARVARPDHFVEGLLVIDLHLLFDFRVLEHQKAPALSVAAACSSLAGQQDVADQFVGHGVGLEPTHRSRRVDYLEYVRSLGHWILLLTSVVRALLRRRRWRLRRRPSLPDRGHRDPL